MGKRTPWRVLPPFLFVLLVVAVYADPLFTGRTFAGRDLVPYGYPLEKATHDAYGRGRLPVWSAEISGGRPIFPNPNTGTLYPLRPLLALVPFPAAMRLFPLANWAAAGIGMILLLRALGGSPAAAWIAAVTYVFSGVVVSEVFYLPLQPGVALLPWTLWAVARESDSPLRKAVPIGLVYGLLFVSGDIFSVVVALLGALLWIAAGTGPQARVRAMASLVLGLFLGGLVAAPQIVATSLLVPETRRAVVPLKLQEVLGFTLSPWRLLELLVPYPFGDIWTLEDPFVWGRGVFRCFFATLYCGAFAFVAATVVARPEDRRARFCRALFAIGALLAVAGSFVPAGWRNWRSPLPLRYPEKFSVAIVLALALAAGLAFDRLRGGAGRSGWMLVVAIALASAACGAWIFPAKAGALATGATGASAAQSAEAARQLPGALAEAGLLWVVTLVALELLRGAGGGRITAALALLTAIPIVANRRIAPTENDGSVFPPTAFARTIARRDPSGVFRAIDEASYRAATPMQRAGDTASPYGTELTRRRWGYHTPVLWGRGTVFNVDVDRGDFSRVDSLRLVSIYASGQPGGSPFFSALALRFGIRFRDQPPLPGYRRFGGDAFQDWDENPAALPEIRLATRWREEPGAIAALNMLPRLRSDEVVLETGRRAEGRARGGALRFLEQSPEHFRVRTSAPDPTWLFVLRGFWSYRTVRVDGREAESVPAQLAFSAIAVPAGEHEIDWREEVPGIELSRFGPVLFVVLAVSFSLRGRTARGRS